MLKCYQIQIQSMNASSMSRKIASNAKARLCTGPLASAHRVKGADAVVPIMINITILVMVEAFTHLSDHKMDQSNKSL